MAVMCERPARQGTRVDGRLPLGVEGHRAAEVLAVDLELDAAHGHGPAGRVGDRGRVGHVLARDRGGHRGGDGQGRRIRSDRQRARDVADQVVGIGRPGDVDLVTARIAGGRRQRQDRRDGQAGGAVAVDQAGVRGRQGGQGIAVGDRVVVGGDGQCCRVDRERAGDVGDRVVGIDGAGGIDRVGADARDGLRQRQGRREGQAGGRVAVDEALVRGRQGRRRAVEDAQAVGGDGQRGRR